MKHTPRLARKVREMSTARRDPASQAALLGLAMLDGPPGTPPLAHPPRSRLERGLTSLATTSQALFGLAAGAAVLALCAAPAVAQDLATRGAFVGGGGGMLTGSATDDEGRGAGAFLGGGGLFRFGEEALPGLTLGLEFLGGSGGGNNDRYDTGFGGFVLQASWRPFTSVEGLVFLLGTGVGGGSLTPKGDDGFEGLAGGSLHELGVLYEFELYRDGNAAFVIAPAVRWWLVPTTADNEVWLQSFSVGIDTTWYAGRD